MKVVIYVRVSKRELAENHTPASNIMSIISHIHTRVEYLLDEKEKQ